jgi:hypothetical protein
MQELYAAQEQERAQLQAAFFSAAADLIKKMIRLKKLSESRGLSMQRWRRLTSDGLNSDLVRQMLEAGTG